MSRSGPSGAVTGNERPVLLALVRGAAASLEQSRQRIDDLNVYPVPDGDTGTNMALSIRAVVQSLESSGSDEGSREALARETARAALMGARGNSGVILSQMIRGATDMLGSADPIDAHALARALRAASDAAYRAVRRPVEGTMLTIMRELAEEAEARATAELTPAELLAALIPPGEDALARTPDQLDVLREAGVVDAGGAGLVEIANMHRQTVDREERLLRAVPDEPNACDVVAVVAGAGNRRVFESLGAVRIVEGGQTMNPATADLVAAVQETQAAEVVLLPNNSNVILSAEQAARLAEKPVHVVPSSSIQAGLAAMVAYDGARAAAENAGEMSAALEGVATGAVTIASRDVEVNGVAVRRGNYLGLIEGDPVVGGIGFEDVAHAVVERLLDEPRELLTLLTGEDAPPLESLLVELAARHPQLELEVQAGGQPHYPLLLAAE